MPSLQTTTTTLVSGGKLKLD
jgi:hypothetical protein